MNRNIRKISYILSALLIVFVCVLTVMVLKQAKPSGESLVQGREYLNSLVAQDVASVNAILQSKSSTNEDKKNESPEASTQITINTSEASTEAKFSDISATETDAPVSPSQLTIPEDWLLQAASASISPLSAEELADLRGRFADTIIIGDSMAQAFLEYGLLDEMHVIYQRGATVDMLASSVTEAAGYYPQKVIFFTGLNDANKYADYNDYTAEYMKRVNEIRALVPGVEVYVCSMLPPSDWLGASRDDLVRAPMFSGSLSDMCRTNGIGYIDTYWMVNQSLYLSDGIHFKSDFYQLLLRYMAMVTGL